VGNLVLANDTPVTRWCCLLWISPKLEAPPRTGLFERQYWPRAGPEVLHQRRDNLAHGVSSAFGRIRSQARARFGDADRKVPSDPEHDKIARDESQKAGVGRRVALDHQTEPNRERLTDYHANDERQQQGHGLTL
jgi:hypothetical protein